MTVRVFGADISWDGIPNQGDTTDQDFALVCYNCAKDCNANGMPDGQDIASGTSRDCNGNGIPDECESPIGACCGATCTVGPQTCCSSQAGAFMGVGLTCADCNGDGVPDACETEGLHPCCLQSPLSCVLWTAECCSAVGGQFFPTKRYCTQVNCTAMAPLPGP
jgi:hypothetical protein